MDEWRLRIVERRLRAWGSSMLECWVAELLQSSTAKVIGRLACWIDCSTCLRAFCLPHVVHSITLSAGCSRSKQEHLDCVWVVADSRMNQPINFVLRWGYPLTKEDANLRRWNASLLRLRWEQNGTAMIPTTWYGSSYMRELYMEQEGFRLPKREGVTQWSYSYSLHPESLRRDTVDARKTA